MAFIPQAEAQNTNHATGTVISWGNQVIPYVAPEKRFTSIAAGGSHSLALKSDGTVVAWGSNEYGQSTVPGGLNGVVAIAAGTFHSLALKSNGTVVAWGFNDYGQSTVPVGLTGVVAIDAGLNHSLALKSDGTVVAWGDNNSGKSTVPDGLNGVVAIAAGGLHGLALIAGTNQNIAPAIVIQASGNNIFLSWPLSAPDFALQSTTNLTDMNSWTTMTNLPVIVDSQNRVIDTISDGAKFYRLKQ